MGEALDSRYWCYMCAQIVNPIMEMEMKCPFCDGGFVEEMNGNQGGIDDDDDDDDVGGGLGAERALSLLAPILLGMMGGPLRSRRFPRMDDESDSDQDQDLDALLGRRRRSSAIHQLLQGFQDAFWSESDASERGREREQESFLLINPFNQAIILQGTFDTDQSQGHDDSNDTIAGASLGDYLIGPGLDMLLQHLAENDPNRYGTPPAQKEAVDAIPTVKIKENLNCSVCLEDFEVEMEVREMPCKHKFHGGCILPWLEIHSSCPVCRFQLPADESKVSNGLSSNGSRVDGSGGDRGNGSRSSSVPWAFHGLFSSSGSQNGGNSSLNPSSSSASESNFHEDEN